MVVVCILSVLFIAGIILLITGFKKDRDDFVVYGIVSSFFLGTFLFFTIFSFKPSKEYINGFIKSYEFTKYRIETINNLDSICEGSKDAIIILSTGLENEVNYINKTIDFNRSRVGTWNEYFTSKEIANLKKINYENL